MKWFWRFCISGLLGSLLLWILPGRLKPYHFHRGDIDYKILFVEYTTEYGLAPNGFVLVHYVDGIEVLPSMGKTGEELNPVREEWFKSGVTAKNPWPTNSNRLEYDEWGPSHWHRPDGLYVKQVGAVFCVPYSMIALTCGFLLALRSVYQWVQRKRRSPAGELTLRPSRS